MTHAVFRKPVGPVAAFSPWNFPFSAPARKIGGALAAGCSIVLKPSEETPGTAVMLAAAFQDAGLPDGVLNLVFGEPAQVSDHLIRRPEIRMVTFTGSVAVGKQLASLAGSLMKPVIMELGGHAPVIVCADADPARAARLGVTAKSRNAGQVCVAPTRFYVHDAVHDAFVADFVRNAEALRLGNGLARDTQMGPLANARRLEAMEGFVEDASAQGARIVSGGRRFRGEDNGTGNFFPLTVLADVPETARCMREEPFGPLALIVRVSSLDEALEKANALPYALAAYAFTDSARAIARMADELDCGNLAVNHLTASFPETPFGGTKDSGYGREGGTEGLEGYMTAKLVSVATE
jgi:succinate-semialdehyde dehydrogenase/glutarate-semialdehyde dehydrogenase